ncbi:ADL163Wp [Eremothecium gossypii ATCC 10895]|uniref:tRNA:m(4)X modification enzyme TRM13 n=1 Tax=Eremothecium gossypii (strain ATCC 10895 / CBS 109.51 / FGSC 9923 / NRRL Y-1056) TaxID=284811 RepID=TRM13_EREGS|nr:ADL163Wp [Eremothecium gossypii ATCC 10895]Q75AT3.2 RecName: Full=tRNA:m(4)X modification enzyme TRM13; AltName: Full=tRNA methylase 13 [Eremothecium gossypii ATCC 10895]AAS51757.2 ADL163Wp [Eremothecium gossypii ATCC 10895]AEY96054.1 FADL163Wp [Eremothecium gossypii FDAG1]
MEASSLVAERPTGGEQDPGHARCAFYLPRKRRSCGMAPKAGARFCAEHQPGDSGTAARVPCPLDPRHTVAKAQLRSHLARCNRTKQDQALRAEREHMPWYEAGVNSAARPAAAAADEATLQAAVMRAIPVLAQIAEAEFRAPLRVAVLSNAQVEHVRFPQLPSNRKHALQQSSLIQHLREAGLWVAPERPVAYVEFGCGRGELSRYINQAAVLEQLERGGPAAPPAFVLVDRACPRMKFDSKFAEDVAELHARFCPSVPPDERPAPAVTRKKIDIRDLRLAALLSPGLEHIAVSKHLCGVATDLTLRCLAAGPRASLCGALIAMCCRHACNPAEYANPAYVEALLARHAPDMSYDLFFLALMKMASWAVSGRRPGVPDTEVGGHFSGLAIAERERLGHLARRLVDEGRRQYFADLGYDAELLVYCERDTSREDIALLVRRPA